MIVTDRVAAPGPKARQYIRAAEGERDSRIRRLAFLVLCMSLMNAIPVLVYSSWTLGRQGVHPSAILVAPIGTIIGGAVLSWGLRKRMYWAWLATMLAFGSLFGGSLFLGALSLYHTAGCFIFLAMVVGAASALPLAVIWRDRGLFKTTETDKEEEEEVMS